MSFPFFEKLRLIAANALLWWAPQIRAGNVLRWPYAEAPTAPIHEDDIAAVAVRALCEEGPRSQISLEHRRGPSAIGQSNALPSLCHDFSSLHSAPMSDWFASAAPRQTQASHASKIFFCLVIDSPSHFRLCRGTAPTSKPRMRRCRLTPTFIRIFVDGLIIASSA